MKPKPQTCFAFLTLPAPAQRHVCPTCGDVFKGHSPTGECLACAFERGCRDLPPIEELVSAARLADHEDCRSYSWCLAKCRSDSVYAGCANYDPTPRWVRQAESQRGGSALGWDHG